MFKKELVNDREKRRGLGLLSQTKANAVCAMRGVGRKGKGKKQKGKTRAPREKGKACATTGNGAKKRPTS